MVRETKMANRTSEAGRRGALLGTAILLAIFCAPLQAQDQPAKKEFNVKGTFRNICSFCHENYGRKEGKGPQLMNSPKTDQELFDRIKHGKPGRMAAFGAAFTDDQIHEIVKFIRNLKPDQDP